MAGVEHRLQEAARKAAAFSSGGLVYGAGVGFLTATAYVLIMEMRTPLFDATILGVLCLGLSARMGSIGLTGQISQQPDYFSTNLPGNLTPVRRVAVLCPQGIEQGRNSARLVS